MAEVLDGIAGFVLAPIVGSVATGLIAGAVKPKDPSTLFWIGALCHAGLAVGASALQNRYERRGKEGNAAFFQGAKWGEGLTGALLAATAFTYQPNKPLPAPVARTAQLLTLSRELKT